MDEQETKITIDPDAEARIKEQHLRHTLRQQVRDQVKINKNHSRPGPRNRKERRRAKALERKVQKVSFYGGYSENESAH